MKVYFGSTRCVLAFPRLGFVLKFPSPHRANWVGNAYWKNNDLSWKVKTWLSQGWFFAKRGVAQNRRERKIWRILCDSFLAPTHFSFLWLVNIQAYYPPSQDKSITEQLSYKMRDVFNSNRKVVAEDAHSWFQVANYSIQSNGSLRKLDYGGENDLEVLEHFLPDLKQIRIK